MQTKYFISHIDCPLGHHLVEHFRTDHLDVDNHSIIVGTSKDHIHPSVQHIINFSKHPQLVCRAVLDCDVVFLDLRSASHEAETIIKFLLQVGQQLSKTIRIIGISSLMTWQGCKSYQSQKDGSQKQKIIGSILNQTQWRRKIWQDHQYKRRIPNNFYIKAYELQNLLLQLNKHKHMKSTILSNGILYGRQNTELSSEILNALNHQKLQLYGIGQNMIHLTHIQSLLKGLELIITNNAVGYLILKDKFDYSQNQIKSIINKVTNNKKELQNKDQLYLSKEECNWSINLQVNSSHLFKDIVAQHNFQSYAHKHLMRQFCQYNLYSPRQVVVVQQQFQPQQIDNIRRQFNQNYMVIQQHEIQKINQELITKYCAPEPETNLKKPIKTQSKLSQQKSKQMNFYKETIQILLASKIYNNFLIICKKQISQMILQMHDLMNISKIVNNDEQPNEGIFIYQSSSYYQHFQLIKPQKSIKIQIQEDKPSLITNNMYLRQKQIKNDEQLIILNQYLLDNVLIYVAQAKFRIKQQRKQVNLNNLINQLKCIWNQSNFNSSSSSIQNKPNIQNNGTSIKKQNTLNSITTS